MEPTVFISLTTIAQRICNIDRVLNSLLHQTLAPDRIILNISLDGYMSDSGIKFEDLPEQTREWVLSGRIELYFCRNTGPYRKIVPVLERFGIGDYYIATADDDVIYPTQWLEVLVNIAIRYRSVAAYRCRVMCFSGSRLAPYNSWPLVYSSNDFRDAGLKEDVPSPYLFPTGRDGVIYHAESFRRMATLIALEGLAPGQDDIALKFATLLAGVDVTRAPREKTDSRQDTDFEGLPNSRTSLWNENERGKNDAVLSLVVEWCRRNHSFELPALL